MPADPKPEGMRRRRNKDAPPVTKLDAGGRAAPRLPFEVSERTVAWWERIWASPMSAVWLDADLGALHRLALLTEQVHAGSVTAMTLGEIRQLEDRFGLTPLARRRLAWELEQAGGDESAEPVQQDDRWLRAVSA